MPPRPSPTITGPRVDEPLVSLFLVVVNEELYATVLHVLHRSLLGHTRDDVEEELELPEHILVHETFGLFTGPHNYSGHSSVSKYASPHEKKKVTYTIEMSSTDDEKDIHEIYIFLYHFHQTNRVVGDECTNGKHTMLDKLRRTEP